ITGFGLLGHGGGMARASGVRFVIDAYAVPFMERVLELIDAGVAPGGTRHNAETHASFTQFANSVPDAVRVGLSDAQTSGGLLISIARERLPMLVGELQERGALAAVIGDVREGAGVEVR
ncbi:MAG: AIR synthase-related protein, partial [Candidatus Cybelea sp.]